MKLTSNANNPCALKVLAAANIAKIKLELEIINLAPESRHRPRLPILIIRDDVRLFSTNSAVTYLMEITKQEVTPRIEQLALIESYRLFPLILSYLAENGDSDQGLFQELQAEMEPIEIWLHKETYLTGNVHGSFGDAIIWSCLYPLIGSSDKILDKFPNILDWAKRINGTQNFASAARQIEPAVGKEAAKVILLCNQTAATSTFGLRFGRIKLQLANHYDTSESPNSKKITEKQIDAAIIAFQTPLSLSRCRRKRTGQILPLKDENNYFITSALSDVSNMPHLGNMISVLSADVFARYCRNRGRNVLYICGTDEYGTGSELKAIDKGWSPQQFSDKQHKLQSGIYQWFSISFDYFGRTSTKEHTEITNYIFSKLNAKGYLKESTVQQLYCTRCERFLTDRFVEGTCPIPTCGYKNANEDQCNNCGRFTNPIELKNPQCKICKSSSNVITKSSEQIILDLPKIEDKIGVHDWLEKASHGWTPNARIMAKRCVWEVLNELCITRDLNWGISVSIPKFKEKVIYARFDALIGYISMTASYTSQWKQWWKNPGVNIEYFQFIPKENVPFHSILFPAMLKGTEETWTTVRHVIGTETLNYEDGEFSKSKGIGVFGNDAERTGIPVDIWRFYLLFIRPETEESTFSWEDFMRTNNLELVSNLGHFINRTLMILETLFENQIPEMNLTSEDYKLIAEINQEIMEHVNLLELCKLRDSLRKILLIAKIGNRYFQTEQPWVVTENANGKARAGTVSGLCAQIIFTLAGLLEPFMPNVSRTIRIQLSIEKTVFSFFVQMFLLPGHKIGQSVPLFEKLEPDMINVMRAKFSGHQKPLLLQLQQKERPKIRASTNMKTSEKTKKGKGKNKSTINHIEP